MSEREQAENNYRTVVGVRWWCFGEYVWWETYERFRRKGVRMRTDRNDGAYRRVFVHPDDVQIALEWI